MDIAAPGVDIPVATVLPDRWGLEDGTSFSVTDRRRSRRMALDGAPRPRCEPGRRDPARVGPRRRAARLRPRDGLGILDMTAALSWPTPLRDSAEPNDTVTTAVAADDPARGPGPRRAAGSRCTRIRATSFASGSRRRSASRSRRPRHPACVRALQDDARPGEPTRFSTGNTREDDADVHEPRRRPGCVPRRHTGRGVRSSTYTASVSVK